jgi:hypothetical protein
MHRSWPAEVPVHLLGHMWAPGAGGGPLVGGSCSAGWRAPLPLPHAGVRHAGWHSLVALVCPGRLAGYL